MVHTPRFRRRLRLKLQTPSRQRPSNLYQANTLRDAVIAGLTLNIFQNHAARVRMANLAQMVNVLQALILTDREKMLFTPTYHVFDLYQGHQGATLLPARVTAPDYALKSVRVPSLSASASSVNGVITVSVVNLDPRRAANLQIDVRGGRCDEAHGRVITAASMDARPAFDAPDPLSPQALEGVHASGGLVSLVAPAKSVVVLELRSTSLKSATGQQR